MTNTLIFRLSCSLTWNFICVCMCFTDTIRYFTGRYTHLLKISTTSPQQWPIKTLTNFRWKISKFFLKGLVFASNLINITLICIIKIAFYVWNERVTIYQWSYNEGQEYPRINKKNLIGLSSWLIVHFSTLVRLL